MEVQELRDAGLKVTVPRITVLQLLEAHADQHLSAEDVYKLLIEEGSDIGLATVYRVLTQFEQAGLVKRHNFDTGQAVFELDHGSHHDHIVCLDCGHVEEFTDSTIEKRQHEIAKEKGFDLQEHSLVLYSHCSREKCPNRRNGSN